MALKENTILNLLTGTTAKLIGSAMLIGIAWGRVEQKYDQTENRILKKIDEHIIKDGFEKQIQEIRVSQLEKNINFQASRIDDIEEYIKPESPEIKTYRK